jgi:hypothetical protein
LPHQRDAYDKKHEDTKESIDTILIS